MITGTCQHNDSNIIVIFSLLFVLSLSASALTFTVTNGNDSGAGSLRQAINDLNSQGAPGSHTIAFNAGLVITPTSEWDGIYYPHNRVNIEGNGSTLNGEELVGSEGGLSVFAPSTIRNLTIINFPGSGLGVYGADSEVFACRIGTDILGADRGNGGTGIIAQNATNLAIGSTDSADANRICYNENYGIVAVNCNGITIRRNQVRYNRIGIIIENTTGGIIGGGGASGRNFISDNILHGIQCSTSSALTIASNFIGLDGDGITAAGNGMHGIYLYKSTDCLIGGDSIFLANIICDNAESGILLENSDNNTILGNYIGISPYEKSGSMRKSTDLGNGGDGITIAAGSTDNLIGGGGAGEPNVITYNQGAGVRITGATTRLNVLYQNSIYGNVEEDIVIEDGANDGIEPPVITGINPVSGTAAPSAVLEIFAKEFDGEPAYIGRTFADGAGSFSWAVDLAPYAGMNLLATQTVAGNTSAFSSPYPLPVAGLEADVAPRTDGDGSLLVNDWVQVGRFVAGLDIPTPGLEFQRADCAPYAERGDAQLLVNDWVQAGRYVAGLDVPQPENGPTGP